MVAAESDGRQTQPRKGLGTVAATLAVLGLVLVVSSGCATTRPSRTAGPRVDALALAREAGAELERGCYTCLRSAAMKYEEAIAVGASSMNLKAAGAWSLVAARERELGMPATDALDRARAHRLPTAAVTVKGKPISNGRTSSPTEPEISAIVDGYVQIVSILPWRFEGVSKERVAESGRVARDLMGRLEPRSPSPVVTEMRGRAMAGDDPVAEYLALSFACAGYADVPSPAMGLAGAANPGSTPAPTPTPTPASPTSLIAFKQATCGDSRDPRHEAETLTRLLADEPRFHEVHYFLGRLALAQKKLISAEREFLAAADGLPQMVAAWGMLGSTRLVIEDYDAAVGDFDRALGLEPSQREILLNRAKALVYAGRFEEAAGSAQKLIDLGTWYQSDANHWLALAELQLGRLHDADVHVREAQRTNPMNGDTARLAGLVAYRLADFDRAQTEFELALSRNDSDCESRLQLGMIHGQKARFDLSVDAFLRASQCYSGLVDSSAAKRAEIASSSLSEGRKEIALVRLGQRLDAYRRSQAAASLGAAEGETQRGAFDTALQHLNDAASHPDFAARVAELKTRIGALRARR